ncbi:hypothetical protein NEHOM01_0258 [Nematocida homosporus]|uniref:uncharacterized protein n=1 Tax=Nematocida homosporus TaxID=1912981 RepID=UPI00221F347C|nr:uncharacterized protein NEHOM01_0258 [Nematocida homosporus]KAI5184583.1 hypothetical protein NEHOM01_0258 [Nematocida homosporus]
MGVFEEELEFFGFGPSEFYKEVYEMVCRVIERSLPVSKGMGGQIDRAEASVERNMLIFERFTLRNIFGFPEGFILERRLVETEVATAEQVKSRVLGLAALLAEWRAIKESLMGKTVAKQELKQRVAEVEQLPSTEEIITGLEEVRVLAQKARELKRKGVSSLSRSAPEKRLLEEEIRRRECEDLESRVPLSILGQLDRVLSNKL